MCWRDSQCQMMVKNTHCSLKHAFNFCTQTNLRDSGSNLWTGNVATLQENSLSNRVTPSNVAALTVPAQKFSLDCLRVMGCHFEICLRLVFCSELLDPGHTDSKCSGRTTCLPRVSASGNWTTNVRQTSFCTSVSQSLKLTRRIKSNSLPELQSSPAKPSWQTQNPSLQTPFLLQLLAQYTSEQSSPTYPGRHWHVPLIHSPWSEQSLRHLPTMQSSPVKDSSHTHSPSIHNPRPEQSAGHLGSEQLSPPKSRSHTHSPSTHTPWPEQLSGQRGSEQFLPVQPSSQIQPHRSKLKLPWPLQPGTKSKRPGWKG